MALKDLILGRKRRATADQQAEAAARIGTSLAPDLPDQAPEGPEGATQDAAFKAAAPRPPAGGATDPSGARRRKAADRIATKVIDGAMAPADRCYAALDRLGLVHDVAEVRLTADDGAAGFVVAARQIVFARFVMQDGFDESFDFRPEPLAIDQAVRFSAVFAAFCARPLDLAVEEKPVAGVFAAEVGLAVADITFDEAVQRAHLLARAAERAEHQTAAKVEAADPAPEAGVADQDPPGPQPQHDPVSAKEPKPKPAGPAPTEPAHRAEVAQLVSASDFPFAFLALCRSQAEDVLRHTRAGATALPAGGRATDGFGEGLGDPALTMWHRKVAAALGPELVVILVPAVPEDRVTVLAMDGTSATAFRAPRQGLGGLCQTAIKAFPAKA